MKKFFTAKNILSVSSGFLGLLVFVFMTIYLCTHFDWAFYCEIALLLPFWSLFTADVVVSILYKKDIKNEKK